MTTTLRLSAAALAVVALAACGDARANDASQDELKRDLELANASTMKLVTPAVDSALLGAMETKLQRAPKSATVVRRVRSETPTVEAEAELDVAEVGESDVTQTESVAPAPESSEPVAVAPRPQPVIIQTGGAGDYGTGNGGIGVGTGVVLRGGGVHGDNCDLHRRGRLPGTTATRGPVILAMPAGTRAGGGSSIGQRAPRTETRTTATTTTRPASRPGRAGLR